MSLPVSADPQLSPPSRPYPTHFVCVCVCVCVCVIHNSENFGEVFCYTVLTYIALLRPQDKPQEEA